MEIRRDWPAKIQEQHWADSAADHYFLALTLLARSEQEVDTTERERLERAAEDTYREAERQVLARGSPPEWADILERVRELAREKFDER